MPELPTSARWPCETHDDIVPFFCAQMAYEAMRARGGCVRLYPYLGKDQDQPVNCYVTTSPTDFDGVRNWRPVNAPRWSKLTRPDDNRRSGDEEPPIRTTRDAQTNSVFSRARFSVADRQVDEEEAVMLRSVENSRDYLRLLARLLWQPGLQRHVDLSDIVQKTLLKAHANLDQFRGDCVQEWKGWLRAILLNELRDAGRDNPPGSDSVSKSSRILEERIVAEHTSPSERALRHEQMERLATALGKLLEDERTAVELKYLHGCSVKFISQQMGRAESAVGGLLKRGMRRLRDLLREPGEEVEG